MENRKIIDYIIISDSNKDRLCTEVLKKINEGYVLFGGASNGGDYGGYTQTMIKYED
jgi:hypothetical protein